MLAVEMRGPASGNCLLHHMAVLLAEALNAKISHVVIKRVAPTDEAAGMVRMVVSTAELRSTQVDAAAALPLAIHTGLPILWTANFPLPNIEVRGTR